MHIKLNNYGYVCEYYSYVDECNMGDDGARHLSKANWPNMQTISICTYLAEAGANKINLTGF